MSLIVPNIVEVSMKEIALWIDNCIDDWMAERATITSNGCQRLLFFFEVNYVVKNNCTKISNQVTLELLRNMEINIIPFVSQQKMKFYKLQKKE